MDKYEYKLKLEQLQNLVAAGDYATASEMADTINWQKVRSVNTLCMVGEIYEKTGKYEACRTVLLQAYDHSPIGRNIVSKLAEVSIKAKKIDEAEEYYNEFLEIAPKDNMRYVLAYEISCLKDEPLPVRIAILEDLKDHEYSEKWAYELAVLYGQAQMRDKCVETCDELILWFGDGEYVEKALDLKRQYQPLTASQEEKYKQFREKKGMVEISIPQTTEPKNVIHEMVKSAENTVTASKFNTSNLEEELAKSMKQIMNATEKETVADTMENIKKIVSDIPYLNGEHEEDIEPAFDKEKINAQVDKSLKKDFKELLSETEQEKKAEQPKKEIPVVVKASEKKSAEEETAEQVASAQASIEEVLEDWKKTKRAAEAAIAAAEQKKLEMAKENALIEAGQIMERLKTLIPILDATPGEDLPAPEETTVAAALASDETFTEDGSEDSEEIQNASEKAEESEVEEASEEEKTTKDVSEATEKAAEEKASKSEEDSSSSSDENTEPADEANAYTEIESADTAQAQNAESASEAVAEETEAADLYATRKMPDVQSYRTQNIATEQTQKAADEEVEDTVTEEPSDAEAEEVTADEITEETISAEAEAEEEDHLRVVEPVPDEELEKTLAQATQMFMENSNVEVPVGKAALSQNTGVLPEIKMPEDIETEQNQYQLTEEQKELFSYFLPVPGMEDQIRQVLLGAKSRIGNSVTSLAGNILVQGEEGSGKTVFATSLIKAIQQEIGNEDAKIGKISAESLNQKDFAALVPKIAGGYLIVDKAGELTRETAVRMSQLMEQNTQGMVVVLEDTRAGIRKAMQLDFGFAKKFTEKVDIPIFTIDELVDFGKSYAKEMECTIDEMGVLALYNRINNIQKLERATTLAEVKDIVDEAIESAEGGGIKRAFGSIFSKKYNENDYLILHEKDFEN
ncbi:hypothetical protein [uncultured Eubacterium sp.]|mgnify:CR=1 FL=1|uniref:hypothetical protein n=1 Tax=uncultured Eubacterium sp. TaxID=165185 RepID=UPI0025E0ACBB|nr:hypothetical protein [uncultured Eubacterium sp.]